MHPKDPINDYLPLTHLSFHVLLALAQGDLHGYAIIQAVKVLSGGFLEPGTGTFYSAIHRLQGDGLLRPVDPPPAVASQDSRRRYYRLTEAGEAALKAEAERLDALLLKVRALRPEVAG